MITHSFKLSVPDKYMKQRLGKKYKKNFKTLIEIKVGN